MKYLVPISMDFTQQIAPRDGFGEGLVCLGKTNGDVVVLTGDLKESTRVEKFAENFPERFIEMGVAEQNMAGVAAGLALSGKIPFITSYAVFSPGRNWDQVRVSICYSKANVKVVGAHAGISVGPDGATHQALEDIAITRVLPNMTVVVPADSIETKKATIALAKHIGPSYIRFGREKTPVMTTDETPFVLGRATQILAGSDVTIIACGQMVAFALEAAQKLDGKLSVGVINLHTIKPIDIKAIIEAAKESGAIVTAEEHQIAGGLGGAVAEVLAESYPVPLERVGIKDTFGESGKPEELMEHYGLTTQHIIEAVERVIKRK
ncbi:transketolase [Candidatus Berkelbacteria bacterium RIFCSPLOWO2_01_FULL_50_28]|uniref:Transketolase n=1 Tax=Candidatus Berkelbacteria bacterium RIFCSPLOWO2_01_FULL_50_28 TaxID=1797471 RepID=A0A1F5EC82_9BACT|nr:MAG: transketolase [Candidatus Berkelbacteria bacterium RIFCSPHIGHO2_01_FULL_50_36]OGD62652.1 MAG: transketolase [Candidatus Berkelbacteria bacterium RIFCSPHIGHO2_12_FULL_50_11]OGD64961.1 MAG: transketolase [Candidatus Berkelbacteria bacterium RIFCSPLOWO2_01_FULL_50_28]